MSNTKDMSATNRPASDTYAEADRRGPARLQRYPRSGKGGQIGPSGTRQSQRETQVHIAEVQEEETEPQAQGQEGELHEGVAEGNRDDDHQEVHEDFADA